MTPSLRNTLAALCSLSLGATAANMFIYWRSGARVYLVAAAVLAWFALAVYIGWELTYRRRRRRG